MNRVTFEIEGGTAICPFNSTEFGFSARLVLFAPARLMRIEAVTARMAAYRDAAWSAEDIAEDLVGWAVGHSDAARAIAEVRHEAVDGVTLTARAVVR